MYKIKLLVNPSFALHDNSYYYYLFDLPDRVQCSMGHWNYRKAISKQTPHMVFLLENNWFLNYYIHTYIIDHYNTSVRMSCASILYVSGGTYTQTSTPNDKFLRNYFHATFIYSQSLCQKPAERKSPNFSYFILISDLKYEPGIYVK